MQESDLAAKYGNLDSKRHITFPRNELSGLNFTFKGKQFPFRENRLTSIFQDLARLCIDLVKVRSCRLERQTSPSSKKLHDKFYPLNLLLFDYAIFCLIKMDYMHQNRSLLEKANLNSKQYSLLMICKHPNSKVVCLSPLNKTELKIFLPKIW